MHTTGVTGGQQTEVMKHSAWAGRATCSINQPLLLYRLRFCDTSEWTPLSAVPAAWIHLPTCCRCDDEGHPVMKKMTCHYPAISLVPKHQNDAQIFILNCRSITHSLSEFFWGCSKFPAGSNGNKFYYSARSTLPSDRRAFVKLYPPKHLLRRTYPIRHSACMASGVNWITVNAQAEQLIGVWIR